MNLRKRISKLKEEGRVVNINRYSLFQFSGYDANKDIAVFWLWCFAFLVTLFFTFWISISIYNGQKRGNSVEMVKLENDRKMQERSDRTAAKKQYIDGCIAAGKAPADLGDDPYQWECK